MRVSITYLNCFVCLNADDEWFDKCPRSGTDHERSWRGEGINEADCCREGASHHDSIRFKCPSSGQCEGGCRGHWAQTGKNGSALSSDYVTEFIINVSQKLERGRQRWFRWPSKCGWPGMDCDMAIPHIHTVVLSDLHSDVDLSRSRAYWNLTVLCEPRSGFHRCVTQNLSGSCV